MAEETDGEEQGRSNGLPELFADLISQAIVLLRHSAAADPRQEAIRIFRCVRGAEQFDAPLPDRTDQIEQPVLSRFMKAVEERCIGAPLAYSVGWTGFRHLVLHTDHRALIPRPETEGLVELALARVRTGTAADIGTGTGAIALSLRHEGEFDLVIGTDISRAALVLARRNARATGLKVSWRLGDLLEPLRGRKVDLLVSNPPYLSVLEYDQLEMSVKEWEPATALVGGPTGLEPYRRLFAGGSAAMNPGGWICVEVDSRRAAETARIANESGWREVRVYDDLFGRPRYVLARWENRE